MVYQCSRNQNTILKQGEPIKQLSQRKAEEMMMEEDKEQIFIPRPLMGSVILSNQISYIHSVLHPSIADKMLHVDVIYDLENIYLPF